MEKSSSPSLLNRTLKRLRRAWSEISGSVRGHDEFSFSPALSDQDIQRLKELIDQCLEAPSGEVSARALAARIGEQYIQFNREGRERFLRLLATEFDVDNGVVDKAIHNYLNAGEGANLPKLRHKLVNALLAPRVRLFTLFNALPDGIKFLVDMRAEIMSFGSRDDKQLFEVERDLKNLLASWFDIGFLKLEQITWQSPASLLEKLIEYEAVHQITSWDDLKNRLAPDRRLYAFFHHNMPTEPLIFVQVALVNGLADNIQALLDTDAPTVDSATANTAIFYSISNAQQGLAGISFGNFLIKRVVASLKRKLPNLEQFATLSPIPGFRRWLEKQMAEGADDLLLESEQQLITDLAVKLSVDPTLQAVLNEEGWPQSSAISEVLYPPLMRLCAVYLTTRSEARGGRMLDPVAHFHLSNGATLQQINWLGDRSANGMKNSWGLMVNYLYNLDTIDENSENYSNGEPPSISSVVRKLVNQE